MAAICQPIKSILLRMISWYQLIKPCVMPACCRFTPSCSQYAKEALNTHTLSKALYLILRRIIRCNPLTTAGHDPVPPAKSHP